MCNMERNISLLETNGCRYKIEAHVCTSTASIFHFAITLLSASSMHVGLVENILL